MGATPFLSVLVPTYNRRKKLAELMSVLVPQIQTLPDVNLVISNNCSPDDTAEYLRRWENEPQIRIINQPCNIGQLLNIGWLYGQATGRYLWLVGDDDLMEPDTVGLLVAKLKADIALGWIHIPGTHELRDGLPPVHTRCPKAEDRVILGRYLFAEYINYIGWMTSNVLQTMFLQRKLHTINFRTMWWPQDLLMGSVGDLPALVLATRKVKAGADSSWAGDATDILDRHFPLSIMESVWLSPQEKKACLLSRYASAPGRYRSLFRLDKRLFLRVTLLAPSLLQSTEFFTKALGRLWK
jgi:glycosyltransferase involved in cell wall biosynthesis